MYKFFPKRKPKKLLETDRTSGNLVPEKLEILLEKARQDIDIAKERLEQAEKAYEAVHETNMQVSVLNTPLNTPLNAPSDPPSYPGGINPDSIRPEQKEIYNSLLRIYKDPEKLEIVLNSFKRYGLFLR